VGAYLATQNIAVGEALAYTRGQRVEADAVKANGWQDLVVPDDSPEAAQIKADITGRPVEDFGGKTTPAARAVAKQTEG
jgi:hypothetical protein